MPVHRRVKRPPPMQLTSRDRQLVQAVYEHRLLRQDQIQRLFFPSRNTANRRRHLPVVPDSYFEYEAGSKRSGFFLEMDMSTMATKRFRDKVTAFLIYKRDGFYQRQFGIHSLRVLTVTPSPRRLRGLNRAYISKIESQKVTNTTVEVAFKLAEALGVSLPYLIGLSDIPLMPGDEDDELAGAGRVVFEARSVEERATSTAVRRAVLSLPRHLRGAET